MSKGIIDVNMRRCLPYLIALLIVALAGCEKTGYLILIEVEESLPYDVVTNVQRIITENGYQASKLYDNDVETDFREMPTSISDPPGQVYSAYEKHGTFDKPRFSEIYVFFLKNEETGRVSHLSLHVQNRREGLVIKEIKADIDKMGDLLYEELEKVVGSERVRVQRIEMSAFIGI